MAAVIVVFDMDGTLVDSADLAWRSAADGLREYYEERRLAPVLPSPEEVRRLVGLPSLEYFAGLLPPGRAAEAPALRSLVIRHEVRRLAAGEGRLYPGVEAALRRLRSCGIRLAIVSNCGRPYLEANLIHLGLGSLVDLALCLDDGPSKAANVLTVRARMPSDGGFMVGDRAADIDAGRGAGLRTVACAFGFGSAAEHQGADHRIEAFSDILDIVGPA